jgi:hypothetical protein
VYACAEIYGLRTNTDPPPLLRPSLASFPLLSSPSVPLLKIRYWAKWKVFYTDDACVHPNSDTSAHQSAEKNFLRHFREHNHALDCRERVRSTGGDDDESESDDDGTSSCNRMGSLGA